jgi:CRISPR/Cas system-associated endoribonuclease Cas2
MWHLHFNQVHIFGNKNRILYTKKTSNALVNIILRSVRVTTPAVEISITYSEWVSEALVTQHAMRMRYIVSPVASPAIPYFSTLPHKIMRFSENCYWTLNAIWFSLRLSFWNISRSKNNSVRCYHKNTVQWTVQYSVFLSEFNNTDFRKFSIIKFHENSTSESRVVPYVQTDGHTYITKPIVTFRNFGNSPKSIS